MDDVVAIRQLPVPDQDVPFIGPPLLHDRQANITLSQVPAIALYASPILGLAPGDPAERAMCMKILMDCNDLLTEICRYNGSMMWLREDWIEFRSSRLPRWLRVFEVSLTRGHLGKAEVTFADISVYALLGNMTRCLPALRPDVEQAAPGIARLCQEIGAKPSLAAAVARDSENYGDVYCGGQIEQSIRKMLAMDAGQS